MVTVLHVLFVVVFYLYEKYMFTMSMTYLKKLYYNEIVETVVGVQ